MTKLGARIRTLAAARPCARLPSARSPLYSSTRADRRGQCAMRGRVLASSSWSPSSPVAPPQSLISTFHHGVSKARSCERPPSVPVRTPLLAASTPVPFSRLPPDLHHRQPADTPASLQRSRRSLGRRRGRTWERLSFFLSFRGVVVNVGKPPMLTLPTAHARIGQVPVDRAKGVCVR